MLFTPWKDFEINLTEKLASIPSSNGVEKWFQIPFKNKGNKVAEIMQNTSVANSCN